MLGKGTAPAKLCLALQRMASNQEVPKMRRGQFLQPWIKQNYC